METHHMKTLWGKFLCRIWFRKHKRGKRISGNIPPNLMDHHVYKCARCGATWTRKVKPKPAEPAIPASIRK